MVKSKAKVAIKCKWLPSVSLIFVLAAVVVEIVLRITHAQNSALWFSDEMWRMIQAISALLFVLSLIVFQMINIGAMRKILGLTRQKSSPLGRLICAEIALGMICFVFAVLLPVANNIIPSETTLHAKDWPAANQNLSNTRAANGSSISASNINKLGLAWSVPLKGVSEWGAAATNPLIIGNTAYFQDLKSNVYAIDIKTGKQLWMKQYNLNNAGPNGLAIGYGKIFASRGHYDIVALDMNGNQKWSTTLSKNNNAGTDIQLSVFNDRVYASTVPGTSNSNFYSGGAYGVIYALDQQTGKVSWSFNTVGSSEIWGNPRVNSGGGAWCPPAFDPKTGNTYWGIGNAGPWPGTPEFPNGTSRPGNNPYTSSIVSLNATNGKLAWYKQVAPHDLFDYDFQISPILAQTKIGNTTKDIVIGAGKMGKVVAFDRNSGEVLWNTPVGTHNNDSLTALPQGVTEVSPGPLGGVETVMAYSSDDVVYVPYVDMTVKYTPTEFVRESFNLGAARGGLTAIDAKTGKKLWDVKLDSMNVGGATVVNDLVFTSTYDGKIYAFNRQDGRQVWGYQAPGNINGWPAVRGDTILFPVGVGKAPAMLAFRIDANTTTPSSTTNTVPGSGKNFQQ